MVSERREKVDNSRDFKPLSYPLLNVSFLRNHGNKKDKYTTQR